MNLWKKNILNGICSVLEIDIDKDLNVRTVLSKLSLFYLGTYKGLETWVVYFHIYVHIFIWVLIGQPYFLYF